jgi:hypothetical protein
MWIPAYSPTPHRFGFTDPSAIPMSARELDCRHSPQNDCAERRARYKQTNCRNNCSETNGVNVFRAMNWKQDKRGARRLGAQNDYQKRRKDEVFSREDFATVCGIRNLFPQLVM